MKYDREALLIVLVVAVIAAAFAIVGTLDSEDAEIQQAEYCENVKDGTWPDFKKNYKNFCKQP